MTIFVYSTSFLLQCRKNVVYWPRLCLLFADCRHGCGFFDDFHPSWEML